MEHPTSSIAITLAAPPLASSTQVPVGHGAARGCAHGSRGGHARFYSMMGRQSLETFPNIVICILTIHSHDVYALIDSSSTLSYMTLYDAIKFRIEPQQLHEMFSVSTPVSNSILAT